MAKSFNQVTLTGNLGKDVEIKTVGEHKVINVSLAVNGYKKDETDWIPVVFWDKLAELVAQYCTKGSKLLVSGALKARTYQAKDGTNRTSLEVVVREIVFLSAPAKGETTAEPAPSTASSTPAEEPVILF